VKILLAALIVLLSLVACIHKGVEPVVRMDLYAYDPEHSKDTGKTQFVNFRGHWISVEDEAIHDLVCTPSADHEKQEEKINRCESWKP